MDQPRGDAALVPPQSRLGHGGGRGRPPSGRKGPRGDAEPGRHGRRSVGRVQGDRPAAPAGDDLDLRRRSLQRAADRALLLGVGRLDHGADGQQRHLDRRAPRQPGLGVERVLRTAGADMGRLTRVTPAILLIGVAAVCWVITARRMDGMDMGPGTDLGGLGWFAVVWATMMAAMMLPSLVPMALTYAGASRDEGASSSTAATVVFVGGYLLTWLGAGVLAYALIKGVGSLDLSWLAWDRGGPY